MNQKEKKLFARLQMVLGELSSKAPSNPMDVTRKSVVCDAACAVSRELYWAISDIGCGHYVEAADRLQRAEDAVTPVDGMIAELERKKAERYKPRETK